MLGLPEGKEEPPVSLRERLMGSSLHLRKEPAAAAAKSLQSCPTVCNPIDSSPPGSSVPGILQARTLEWNYQKISGGRSSEFKGRSRLNVGTGMP